MSTVYEYIKNLVQEQSDNLKNDVVVKEDTDIFAVTDSLARLELMYEIEGEYFNDNQHDLDITTYTSVTVKQLVDLVEEYMRRVQ
jgi:acyl carrier protein